MLVIHKILYETKTPTVQIILLNNFNKKIFFIKFIYSCSSKKKKKKKNDTSLAAV